MIEGGNGVGGHAIVIQNDVAKLIERIPLDVRTSMRHSLNTERRQNNVKRRQNK